MKKNYLFMLLIGITVLIGCSKDSIDDNPYSNFITIVNNDDGTNNGTNNDPLYNKTLWAGQNTAVGSGTVNLQASDNTITVTYTTDSGWEILETHLYIGTYDGMPMNNGGNPKIGQFPYSEEHPAGTTSFTYYGPEITTVQDADGCFVVAVHAVVINIATGETETAWLEGLPFPGNSWAMYGEICN